MKTQFLIRVEWLMFCFHAIGLLCALLLLSNNFSQAIAQSVRLNDPLPDNGKVVGYWIAPDSSRVVYQAAGNTAYVYELFSAPIDRAGGQVLLSDPLPFGGSILGDLEIAPDSSRAIYQAVAETSGVDELFSSPIDCAGGQVKLNNTLPSGGGVFKDFQISSDSTCVVYMADGEVDNVFELYSRPIDGSDNEVKINNPLPAGGNVSRYFHIAPDTSRVVYQADGDVDGRFELYSRPIDGSGVQTRISDWSLHGKVSDQFKISNDSHYVVYRTLVPSSEHDGIYSRPIDGSGSPIKLNDPFPTHDYQRILGFEVAPDSSRVVYTTDADTNYVRELYSAPIDRPNGQVKLNSTFQAEGDIRQFQISPDSTYVVYLADGDFDEIFELYSRPIEGSGIAVKLNDPFPVGGSLFHWKITPDSTRVIFMADAEIDDRAEVFSVPIDGGDQVKLNAPLSGPNDGVADFEISTNGQWIVYKVNENNGGHNEILYAMTLDGSVEPFQLTRIESGDIVDYQISPDSQHVVYVADPNSHRMFELFSVPLVAPIPEPATMLLAFPISILCVVQRKLVTNHQRSWWLEEGPYEGA